MLSILAIIALNIILINAIENIEMYYIFTALINGLILFHSLNMKIKKYIYIYFFFLSKKEDKLTASIKNEHQIINIANVILL